MAALTITKSVIMSREPMATLAAVGARVIDTVGGLRVTVIQAA
jgi:hypothetical protein